VLEQNPFEISRRAWKRRGWKSGTLRCQLPGNDGIRHCDRGRYSFSHTRILACSGIASHPDEQMSDTKERTDKNQSFVSCRACVAATWNADGSVEDL
jgi:hypothetical protein